MDDRRAALPHYACAGVRPEHDSRSKGADLWVLDSVNSTGWKRGLQFLECSSADAACLQEHWQSKTQACDEASAAARASGWSLSLGQAVVTTAGGASAGVAIGGRSHFGLGRPNIRLRCPASASRVRTAWFPGVVRGGVHIISVYLWTGEALCSAASRNLGSNDGPTQPSMNLPSSGCVLWVGTRPG